MMFWIGLLSGILLSGIVLAVIVVVFGLIIPGAPIGKKTILITGNDLYKNNDFARFYFKKD